MSRKITQEEFLKMFESRFPDSSIEIIKYTAISNPSIIKCKKCGKIYHNNIARQVITSFHCCGSGTETRYERAERLYEGSEEYDYIKKVNKKTKVIIRHNVCGNESHRAIHSVLGNPFSCKYCNTREKKARLTIEQAQEQVPDSIEIIEYNGADKQNYYKCLKCGFIFKQKQVCLIQSRGCPKCDRYKSKGESFISNLLARNNINFKEQIRVNELPLQSFDFGVYNESNELLYYIEVQGEQHYRNVDIFKDSLKTIQRRDKKKRAYCRQNNIPLYELKYIKGKFLNLDILPFEFNDYPREEE